MQKLSFWVLVFYLVFVYSNILRAEESLCPQDLRTGVYNSKIKGGLESAVMSHEKALGFFNEVQKSKYGIPFKYVEDGCDMRALLISKTLKEKFNLMTFRVAIETKSELLNRSTPYTAEGIVEFNRHTATAICVQNPKTKKIEPYIFDPSFFKHPVPLLEWRRGFDQNGTIKTKLLYGNIYSLDPRSKRKRFLPKEMIEVERLRKVYSEAQARMLKTGVKPYGVGRARGFFDGGVE